MPKRPRSRQRDANPLSSGSAETWRGALREHKRRVVIPSFDFRVDYCAASITGSRRTINQDALLCLPGAALFTIADGMGGHAAGEVAAQLSLEAIEKHISTDEARAVVESYAVDAEIDNRRKVFELVANAMRAANDAVLEAGEKDEARRGMGTTVDLVMLVRDRAFFAHVGDSRAYLVRPTATLQLTHDHAAYDSLRSSGKRSPARARSPLNNSIGHRRHPMVDTLFVDIGSGDRIVLCTDGVFNALDGESAFARACRTGNAEGICRALISAAHKAGANDDASVIAISIEDRFVRRKGDAGPRARDIETIACSPLLSQLKPADVLAALAAGVEIELGEDDEVPRAVANDRVAYVILEGLIALPNGRKLGASGLLMAESLLDVAVRGQLPKVVERARLLRIRHDDFNEVCAHDSRLAVELYKRLAKHLATVGPSSR